MRKPGLMTSFIIFLVSLALAVPPGLLAQSAGSRSQTGKELMWPRVHQENGLTISIYQPQIEQWEDDRIGTRTAKRCLAMEMNVLVYDPYKPAAEIRSAGYEPVGDLDATLPRADFVSIHCPKTPETIGLFIAVRLKRMKPSAYLINTARGGIIDEAALYDALTSSKLAGAGLDVFAQEPPPVPNPLFELPNVIIAPHVAGVTWEAVDRMSEQTAHNILSALDGAPIRENVINQDVLD